MPSNPWAEPVPLLLTCLEANADHHRSAALRFRILERELPQLRELCHIMGQGDLEEIEGRIYFKRIQIEIRHEGKQQILLRTWLTRQTYWTDIWPIKDRRIF